MKTKLLFIGMLLLSFGSIQAQNQATVYAKNSDISDNLDLRAVASIFGESSNLQDFERRLNDPNYQISNLDLNNDGEVDYLRVIESVEDRTHVIIIQAVLDRDVYQDIATIDVERDNYNKVSVQVVGNSYLYGNNYIYEPVYNVAPPIYSSFWAVNYRPYYSSWSWGVFPSFYVAWKPFPIFRYRNNVNVFINSHNQYNYVNIRRSYRAPRVYESRRAYGYEKMYPNYGFAQRHANFSNRYDLDQRRIASRESNRNSYGNNRVSTNRNGSYTSPNRVYSDARQNGGYKPNNNFGGNSNGRINSNDTRFNTPSKPIQYNNKQSVSNAQITPNVSVRRDNNQNNGNYSRANVERKEAMASGSGNQRFENSRAYSDNKGNVQRNDNSSRAQNVQRPQVQRSNQGQDSRGSQAQRNNGANAREQGGRRM